MHVETSKFWLKDAEMTHNLGASLAGSLHIVPLTILLDGELGSGKTTFLQGLAAALGIPGPVSSPTFALEQRYRMANGQEFVHLDLYRLNAAEASALLRETEDLNGIRCIEWASRLPDAHWNGAIVRVRLGEDRDGRSCKITFADIPLPEQEQIDVWRKEVMLPENIIAHCDAVAVLCDQLSEALWKRGIAVRKQALHRGAQLHDLVRFIDFKAGAAPAGAVESPEQIARWNELRAQLPTNHEDACSAFLAQRGFAELGKLIEPHGLRPGSPPRKTIEEDLLFYADKRAIGDHIVTLQERLDDLEKRYGKHLAEGTVGEWLRQAKEVERKLFPEGAPV